jgi:site-specific DNA recombinase
MRNRNGNKINKSTFHRLMSDPFYCGYIFWNGKEFDGKHKPIITEQLFNEVQDKLKRKYKAGQQKNISHFQRFG